MVDQSVPRTRPASVSTSTSSNRFARVTAPPFRQAASPIAAPQNANTINGNVSHMPELLRMKGALLLAMPNANGDAAEKCFVQSLEVSRRQGALGWELRTAVDLAALLASRGEAESSRTLLRPVLERFVEGLDTLDVQAATRLLATLA